MPYADDEAGVPEPTPPEGRRDPNVCVGWGDANVTVGERGCLPSEELDATRWTLEADDEGGAEPGLDHREGERVNTTSERRT